METILISAFFAALVLLAIRYWRFTLVFISTMLLAASCSHAANFEVAVVIESEADRVSMQDAVRDADDIFSALGLDLTVTYIEVGEVATHTHAQFLLDAVQAHRLDSNVHRLADATVLFTRRDIRMGGTDYTGVATVGPACSASASAIVELRNDGNDGAILAHELLHTLGVPHDHAQGWLMSEGVSRTTARSVSQDTILTVRAAGVGECMTPAANNPPPAAVQPAPAAQPSTGGGGSFDWLLALGMAALAVMRRVKAS